MHVKEGRKIVVISPCLRRLRNNLREVLSRQVSVELHEILEKYRYLESLGEEISDPLAWDALHRFYVNSICRCGSCGDTTSDMTFLPEDNTVLFPNTGVGPGWFCPKCFDLHYNFKKKKIYPINEYLSVRMRKSQVFVYINNKRFESCVLIALDIPLNEEHQEINSIDEAEQDYKRKSSQQKKIFLPVETQFQAHCSNLDAWFQNDYDTRILHRNIAFPLLKELTKAGDPKARKVFKEEIAQRYLSGASNVKEYLRIEGYLDILSKAEREAIGIYYNR